MEKKIKRLKSVAKQQDKYHKASSSVQRQSETVMKEVLQQPELKSELKFEHEGAGNSLKRTNEKVSRMKQINLPATGTVKVKAETDSNTVYHMHNGQKCNKFVGAHMSIAGGLFHSIEDGESTGCKAVGIFLKNQRQWNSKPLQDKDVEKFRDTLSKYSICAEHILPHGSYLMNCGSPNEELRDKSRASLLDDAKRCEKLGIKLLNFHPGSSTGKISVNECCQNIAVCINFVHAQTSSVMLVLENMCGQGNTVGSFQEIANIISLVNNKSRIGVCLDTCHAYAFGYDLNNKEGYEAMISEFDETIGLKYLKGVHLNDSKGKRGCHLDRHENIGRGEIGINCFKWIMNDCRFDGVPMILETPFTNEKVNIYEKEVALLYSLCIH